jgi:hypothetical protein
MSDTPHKKTPQEQRKELEEVIKEAKANAEHTEMLITQQAEWHWLAFSKLKERGFTDRQALTIVVRRGPFLSGPST